MISFEFIIILYIYIYNTMDVYNQLYIGVFMLAHSQVQKIVVI